jgi:spore germination protein KC
MKRRLASILSLALLSGTLCGCWDRKELNDVAFTLATGIDAAPDNRVAVSLEIPIPAKLGKGSNGGKPYTIVSTEGADMRNVTQLNSNRMSRRVSSSHRRVVIICEEIARRGIRPLFDSFTRVPENRLNGILVIAKGKAIDLLKGKTPVDEFSWEALREIIRGRGRIVNNVKNLAQSLTIPQIDPIVVYMGTTETKENGPNQIQLLGYAQFKDDKMIGVYGAEEMSGIHWLSNQITPHELTFALPSGQILTIRVLEGHSAIRPVQLADHRIRFEVRSQATCSISEDYGMLDLNDLKIIRMISAETGKQIKSHMEKTFERMQQSGTDSVALGYRVNRKFPRLWREQLRENWQEQGLKRAELSVQMEVHIAHTGLVSNNAAKNEEGGT